MSVRPVRTGMLATALAGPYFGALLGQPPRSDEVETIARGLSAGWDVSSGMIRSAMFVSEVVEQSPDPGLWLDATVSWPLGRATLLDPGTEEVAVGPLLLGNGAAVGAIVSGYRFYRSDDHSADVRTLLSRVLAARVRLKLPPPRLLDLDQALKTATAEVLQRSAALTKRSAPSSTTQCIPTPVSFRDWSPRFPSWTPSSSRPRS